MKGAEPSVASHPKEGASTDARPGDDGAAALALALEALMKPERIRAVRVIHAAKDVVSGFLLTNCPLEGQDHWKDFEAHLHGPDGSVRYAVVDGRRVPTEARGGRAKHPIHR